MRITEAPLLVMVTCTGSTAQGGTARRRTQVGPLVSLDSIKFCLHSASICLYFYSISGEAGGGGGEKQSKRRQFYDAQKRTTEAAS